MPRRDGTGPEGRGPGTGRRRGSCFDAFTKKDGSISVWRTLVIPMVGAIINDFRKPDSISRRTVNSIVNRIKTKRITDDRKSSKEIDGSYSVVDTEKGE
ncbi:MAG: DUF5320 family protein [Candidatus Celaenobacter antarcticus]|nr:DUF5320 family protein [Candidatus Celaenobacter antarcticus]